MISAGPRVHRYILYFAVSVGAVGGLHPANASDGVCHLIDFYEATDEAQLRAEWFELWDDMNPVYAVKELKTYINQLRYQILLIDQEVCIKWEKRHDNVHNLRFRLRRAYSVLRKLERPHQ